MRKIYLLLVSVMMTVMVNAQVTVTNPGNTIPGLAATYASLAAAITDLNLQTAISGPVTITLDPANPQTAPAGGYAITALLTGASSTNTVTFDGSGNTITAFTPQVTGSAASSFDAIFKIIGSDFITVQNFSMQENAGNTVITPGTTNTMTEFGVLLVHGSATDGSQNNIIQNNTITLNSTYTNSVGIFSTSSSSSVNAALAATSTAGTNSNNKIYGNTISNVAYGIWFICEPVTVTINESGNDIGGSSISTGNNITFGNATASSGPWNRSTSTLQAGINYRNGAGHNIRFNTVTSNSVAYVGSAGLNGILVGQNTAPVGVTYTTTVSDNTVNITSTGVALMTGIDFGVGLSTGTIVCNNNTVTLNQNATTTVSAAVIGIKANYAAASSTLNTNNITINQAFTATATVTNSSAVTGITIPSGTTGTPTMNVLGNAITINRSTTVSATFTATMSGNQIGIQATTATTTMNIGSAGAGNNNTITIKEAVGGGAGTTTYSSTITYIDANATHATVNVVNNTLNTTGSTIRSSGSLTGINQNSTVTTLVNIRSNTLNVDRVAASGTLVTFTSTTGTPSEVADSIINNNITFTSLAGTSTVTGISSLGGPTTPVVNNKRITGNTINISGTHTGTSVGITCSFTNTGFITGNSVTITSASPTVTGITTSSTAVTISGNSLSLISSTTSPTAMTGLLASSTTGGHTINNNTFTALNFNGIITGSPVISGISVAGGTASNVFSNVVTNITVGAATSTANPVADGILVTGGVSVNVFKNKIYGILSNCTGATGVVNGIRISGGGTTGNSCANNLIGDLTAPASTNPDAVRGISITSSSTTTALNIVYNTVYLSGGGGTNFGSSGIFHTASATATTAALNLRNNIIVNNTTPNGTGLAVAYRRSLGTAGTLANYASTSNNNLFYAGTPGTSNLIYADGTSTAQTITAYKSGVFTAGTIAPRDAASVSENPPFLSTSGASSNFLHIDPSIATQVESGALPVTTPISIADDYDNESRNITTPDIGADEGTFTISSDIVPPSITYTTLSFTCLTGDRALNGVTIADASGVPTAGALQPRIYYKKNAGSYFSSQGSLAGGSGTNGTWNFTIVAADMGGVAAGDVISYFVIAQDIATIPNIASNPSAGLVAIDVNTVTTPPTTPNTYSVSATLSGSYNVGTGQTYTTLTAAINAYNTSCLGGPVTFLLTDASYTTTSDTIRANADASVVNTLTIKPTLSNTTITGNSASAVLVLSGADYIIINGSTGSTVNSICPPVTASRNLTITNSNTGTSSAVIWLLTNGADAATNNVIKNCNITGNSTTTTLIGIGSGSSTISTSSLGTGNNNNSFENNNIKAVQVGIYSQGASAANKNTGNIINQNVMNNPSGSSQHIRTAGIFVGFENNISISGNTIGSVSGSSGDGFGIACGSIGISTTTFTGNEVINATITYNKIDSIRAASTFSVSSIYIVTSTNAGTNLIANNTITNEGINGTAGDFGSGIFSGGGAVTTNIYFNSVSMSGTFTGGTQPNFALAVGGSNPVVNIRNNALSATAVNGGGTALGIGAYAIGYGYSTFTNLTVNNNDYFTSGAEAKFAKTGSLATAAGTDVANLAALQAATGQDAASIALDPLFNNLSNLQPQLGSPLVGAGVPAGSITTDILCNTRSVTTPTIGAYEVAADAAAPAISYTLLTTNCTTGDRLLNGVTITDLSGVPTAGALQPRVYYRKNAGSWFSSQGTLAGGTGTNGTWNFTIVAADMGGLTGGDNIQYYVIAQDVAAIPNIGSNPSAGLVATDVNTVITHPATPNIVSVGVTLNGTYTVGSGGNYPTLTAAVTAYNNGCLAGPVIFELTDAGYSGSETFPLAILNNADASAVNTLTIRPTLLSSVSGLNATAIFQFNGARYVTIDGRIGSTGTTHSLTVTNTNTTAPAVVFINDANNDVVKYTDLKSDNTSTTSGVVLFSTTTGANGNDNNTIDNCNIGPNAANPTNGITSVGTTTLPAQYNSGNTISNCNIFDFFSATSDCNGVFLSSGSDAWTIQNNSFYQTASRTFTTSGSIYGGVQVTYSSGNNFLISGNYIGGSAALCAGSPTTLLGNGVIRAIRLSVGTTTPTSVQGNTIQNISMTSSSTSTSQSAISLITGSVNCGNITGNTIGSQSADASTSPSIDVSISGSAAIFTGLLAGTGTPGTYNISNNTVGGIRVANTGAPATGTSSRGIGVQGAPTSLTLNNNVVGSTTTANSFVSSTTSSILGIFLSTTNTGSVVSNNTVANARHTGTTATSQLIGMLLQGSSGGSYVTTVNTVRDLTSSAPNIGTGSSSSVVGISHTASTTAGQTLSQNTVFSLSNTDAAAATAIAGIHYTGPTTGTNTVARNLVYNLNLATTSATAEIRGINFSSGLANVQNNMIRLGTTVANGNIIYGLYEVGSTAASGIYFNSVYVGGSGVGTQTGNSYAFRSDQTTNIRTFQNNIFINARSNATTGGKHYAVRVAGTAPNPAGLTLNYNDYQVTGTGGVFGFFNSLDVADLAAWKTAVGQDVNSISGDPQYIDPIGATPDLHIHASNPTPIEGAGVAVVAVTDDYDGQTRASFTPTDIGADAGNFVALDISAPNITYTALSFTCSTGDRALNGVTITDASGVPTTGSLQPRIYYKKGVGGTWFSSQGILAGGTGTNGTWNFTIVAADMGGLVVGDAVYYYVIAQDIAGTPNIAANPGAGLVATDVNTVTTPPTTPNNYNINNTLSGTYTVGAAGTYTTLTAAVAAYNVNCLGGPVVFELIDASYSGSETFPISVNANPDASSVNTLTIRPGAGIAATITGTSGAIASSLIRLNGARYVIFDGINTGGASLTAENTSTTAGTSVFWLSSNGVGLGASNNIIRNSFIKAGVSQNAATTNTYGIIIAGSTLSGTHSSITAGDDNDNNTIQANIFTKVRYAIYTRGGGTANANTGTVISNNIVGPSAFGADEIGKGGVLAREEDGIQITGNEIRFVGGDFANTTGGADRSGITFGTDAGWTPTSVFVKNAVVTKNKIHDVIDERTFSASGISVGAADGANPTSNLFANNMIYNIKANGTVSDQSIGIGLSAANGDRVVFNSIYMTGDTDPDAGASTPSQSNYGISISTTSVTNPLIADNIVYMDLTSSSAPALKNACINVPSAFAWGTGSSNYNDFYIVPANTQSNIGCVGGTAGTFHLTLAAWQTAVTQDANSVSIAPVFVSATDLHLAPASNCSLHRRGTPVTGITTDIDNDTRHALRPDMGADEYTLNTTGTITWTGAVSNDWFDVRNWDLCELPGSTSEVVINGSLPNYPLVTSNVTIKKLTQNTGANIEIVSGVVFNIIGF